MHVDLVGQRSAEALLSSELLRYALACHEAKDVVGRSTLRYLEPHNLDFLSAPNSVFAFFRSGRVRCDRKFQRNMTIVKFARLLVEESSKFFIDSERQLYLISKKFLVKGLVAEYLLDRQRVTKTD